MPRIGARRWMARIMISWGLISAGMMFVRTPLQFYIMRLLLGAAEAGFWPTCIYYLAYWYPAAHRGRAISRFYCFGGITSVVGGALSGWLLGLDGSPACVAGSGSSCSKAYRQSCSGWRCCGYCPTGQKRRTGWLTMSGPGLSTSLRPRTCVLLPGKSRIRCAHCKTRSCSTSPPSPVSLSVATWRSR